MSRLSPRSRIAFAILPFLILLAPFGLFAQPFCQGTDFYLALAENYTPGIAGEIKIVANVATTGTITSGLGLNQAFSVSPGTPYVFAIPGTHTVSASQSPENKGIRITANNLIAVYAGSGEPGTGDAVSLIPVPNNGTDFYTSAYNNLYPSRVLIVGTANGTTLTITPKCATASGNPANVPFTATINQGQTYSVNSTCDLTGTRVQSNLPIQVFSYTPCGQVPSGNSYCDMLWETAIPVSRWSNSYVSGAMGGRNNIDMFRFLAATNNTTVYVNGTSIGTINAGNYITTTLSGGNVITATAPISVMQYARSAQSSGNVGDPAMMHLYPTNMFTNSYRFPTLLHGMISSHYVTIVSRSAGTASVRLDGAVVPGWVAFGSGWSYAQRVISTGEHTLTSDSLMHAMLYGWNSVESYATPVGAAIVIIPLPIEDAKLQGTVLPEGNKLSWVRPADAFDGYFELERSLDAQVSTVLNTVQVDPAQQEFSFLDQDVKPEQTWFYRLRWITPNGEVSASDWIALHTGAGNTAMQVFPNPVKQDMQLSFEHAPKEAVQVRILDLQGREVHASAHTLPTGTRNIDLAAAVRDLAKGLYTIEANFDGQRLQQKFVRQ